MKTLNQIIKKIQRVQDSMEKKIVKIHKTFDFGPSSIHQVIQEKTQGHQKRIVDLYRKYELLTK